VDLETIDNGRRGFGLFYLKEKVSLTQTHSALFSCRRVSVLVWVEKSSTWLQMGSNLQSQWWQEYYLLGRCVVERGTAKSYLPWSSMNNIFWEDVWLRDVPLKPIFPEPEQILSSRKLCGSKRYHWSLSCQSHIAFVGTFDYGWMFGWREEWNINFRRAFWQRKMNKWQELLLMLSDVHLNDQQDEIRWLLENIRQILLEIHAYDIKI